jgi:hypothetical protein
MNNIYENKYKKYKLKYLKLKELEGGGWPTWLNWKKKSDNIKQLLQKKSEIVQYKKQLLQEKQEEINTRLNELNELKKLKESRNKDKTYKLNDISKEIYLLMNAKEVYTNIFNLYDETNEIVHISYNYNILLKYSYCNKFLELLQLIYKMQLKITSFDITTINPKDNQNIKIFNKENFNYIIDNMILEDYIIINIINVFISPISKLKNKFTIIHEFYKEEQLRIEEEQLRIKEEKMRIEEEKQLRIENKTERIKKKILKIEEKKLRIKEEKSRIEEEKLRIEKQKTSKIEEEKLKQDYNNAKETYINISDTTLLFQYISSLYTNSDEKQILKKNVLNNIKQDLEKKDVLKDHLEDDIKQISFYLEDDIKQIKKLLLFNLYVDNIQDISPKFSYIFYASFIYYRINKPLISYSSLHNLYPINENNFVCNLIGIKSDSLIKLIKDDDDESINKHIFNSSYIKHPIHSYDGIIISIKIQSIDYQNCTENGILEFIKILFWDQKQFVIKLPEEIDIKTEPLQKLNDIFNDINTCLKNQTNIKSLYESPEYHKKIHELFINKNNIKYKQNNYEVAASVENFYNMLCIILNFESIEKLQLYFNNINNHIPNITKIEKIVETYNTNINIYIQNEMLYTINITNRHVKVNSINNTDILKLIEYDYFNLLIYNTDILSKYDKETCSKYINKYITNLSELKQNDKNYEYLVELIIIKNPELSEYLYNIDINKYEKIILSAIEKNPVIICYLSNYNRSSLEKFLNIIVNNLDKDKEHENYKKIVKCIFDICKKNIFDEIILSAIKKNPEILCNNELYNFDHTYIEHLIDKINLYKTGIYYKNIVKCILITLKNIKKLDKLEKIINFDKDYFFDNCLEIVMTIASTTTLSYIMEYLFENYKEIILEQIKNKPEILSKLNFQNEVMVELCNEILNDLNKENKNYIDIVKYIVQTSGVYEKLDKIIKIKNILKDPDPSFNEIVINIIINADQSYIYSIINKNYVILSNTNILIEIKNKLNKLETNGEKHKNHDFIFKWI